MFRKVRVFAAVSVAFDGGVPVVAGGGTAADPMAGTCQNGNIDSLGNTAQGITTVNLKQGVDANECWCSLSFRGANLAGSDAISGRVNHSSDTAKVVSTVQEAAMGGASTLQDLAFDLVIFQFGDP